MSACTLKQTSLCWFTLAEHLVLISIYFIYESGRHWNSCLSLTRGCHWPEQMGRSQTVLQSSLLLPGTGTVRHSSWHQLGCFGMLGLGWEPCKVYKKKNVREWHWEFHYINHPPSKADLIAAGSLLSLCIPTAPHQGATTTLAPPLWSKKWWRWGHEFQSWKQIPHVRVIIGPFGEGDSLSTLKFGKLRQGCYILQVHPPETIPSISQGLSSSARKVISFNVIPARPWERGQGVMITWGLISWEHRIKTHRDLYLIPSFATDFETFGAVFPSFSHREQSCEFS